MRDLDRATVAALALNLLLATPLLAQEPQPIIREVLKTGPEWVSGVAAPASGRFLVYATDNAIRIYNRRSRQTVLVPIAINAPVDNSLSLSRSGRRLVFPRSGEVAPGEKLSQHYIWSLDLDTLTGAPLGEPHRVSIIPARNASISADGRWIAMSTEIWTAMAIRAPARLLVIPSEGGEERTLDSAAMIMNPRWSPDGKTIYYRRGDAFARISLTGGPHDSLGTTLGVIDASPDGRFIATGGRQFQSLTRQVVDANGAMRANIPMRPEDWLLTWPGTEGYRLLGHRYLEPTTLTTMSLTDGKLAPYAVTEPYAIDPAYSPDGKRVAMVTRIGDRRQLVIYDVATRARQVLNTPQEPVPFLWHWSPDGSRIAFLATKDVSGRDLFVIDVGSRQMRRLANVFQSTFARWRDDGKAIDFIQGRAATGRDMPEVHRVTMDGTVSIVRTIPLSTRGKGAPFQLITDSLVVVPMSDGLLAVPLPAGEPRVIYSGSWSSTPGNLLSPDRKSVAIEVRAANRPFAQIAIVSLDGKSVRRLGLTQGCDVMPVGWLRDGSGLVAWGADNCNDWHEEYFIVPIDGGAARPITLPPHQAYSITPDGRSLLIAADAPKIGSIIEFDLTNLLAAPASPAAKPAKGSRP